MNPLSIVESWIVKEMLEDEALAEIVGDKIYYGAPEDEAEEFFVLVTTVDARPFYTLGTKREHAWAWYDIVVWQKGKDTRSMKAAANRIDDMFSVFRNRTFTQSGEAYYFYSQSTRPISRKDTSTPPFVWRGLGGTYKISATKQ